PPLSALIPGPLVTAPKYDAIGVLPYGLELHAPVVPRNRLASQFFVALVELRPEKRINGFLVSTRFCQSDARPLNPRGSIGLRIIERVQRGHYHIHLASKHLGTAGAVAPTPQLLRSARNERPIDVFGHDRVETEPEFRRSRAHDIGHMRELRDIGVD